MLKRLIFVLLQLMTIYAVSAQDSVWIKLRPKYNQVSGFHKLFFGENYRKEWSDSTHLPVIRLSSVDGGLRPLRLGGGHQTISLRMVSAKGNEWVLRNIEKDASILLPVEIRQTFARDVIDDAMSAQHPFSPLVVAELAEAVDVPHANPVIGVVHGDTALGAFYNQFAGKVCLLEEREPIGNSESSARMFQDLNSDNDNSVDGEAFLRAQLLDLLIGDWDRHPDQWRWVDTRKGKTKKYVGIPRDRDQAFYVNQGLIPRIVSRPWFVPSLQGFRGDIWFPKFSLKESSFMHSRAAMHMSYEKWMAITQSFVSALPDDVLKRALKKLPTAAYDRRHEELLSALRERRENIPAAMHEYYHFVNRIAELQLSDKHELVKLSDSKDGMVQLNVLKVAKKNTDDTILSTNYDPKTTREIRLFTGAGNDSVVVDVKSSPVRIRIIGGEGNKKYHLLSTSKKVRLYEDDTDHEVSGQTSKLQTRVSSDSIHTAYTPANRYNVMKPLVTAGFNRDDGFLIGLGLQYTHHGFRKTPYAGLNRIMLHHSFATSAFRVRYSGEFIHALGKADIVTLADIFAPQNTHNFFGRGNESIFNKTGNRITFYRTRFNLYNLSAGLRWRTRKGMAFIASPVLQVYRFDSSENKGRILDFPALVNSYDSSSLTNSKVHGGLMLNIGMDRKNNHIIPTSGYYFNVRAQGFKGFNSFSESYGQLLPEFVAFVPLNSKKTIVLAERLGGGWSFGKPTFYQSLFAGGHENLLGYRQFRFAGDHMMYNNIELRIKVANFTGYIIPGEFGMIGFYDAGRVWVKDERSTTWHTGAGGGLYFAPAKMAVFSLVAGHSKEGWYPYITFGFRY